MSGQAPDKAKRANKYSYGIGRPNKVPRLAWKTKKTAQNGPKNGPSSVMLAACSLTLTAGLSTQSKHVFIHPDWLTRIQCRSHFSSPKPRAH